MKTKTRNILTGAAVAVLLGGAFGGVGALGFAKGAAEEAAGTKSLTGFTCPGASVFIATDGSDTKQMRFQINLTAAQAAYAGEGKTAGVVVLPYDIYKANGVTALTKDTTGVATADVSALWEENAEGGYSSYAYLDTKLIPSGQENRMLVARGYIEDGENIYYTEEVKASMAYVAWQNYNKEEFSAYREVLKSYMGPYTLTYGTGENEKIGNLYYGDEITLPEKVGDYSVEAWYWDSACTDKIVLDDYATGSMQIYYELKKVSVSGTITAPDGVDVTKTIIYANGKDTGAMVETNGNFTIRLSINAAYDLTFENGDYIAFADGVEVSESGTEAVNVTLKKNTYAVGDYKNVKTSSVSYDKNAALDGTVKVSGVANNYTVVLPNVATSKAAEYNFQMRGFTWNETESIANEMYYGFGFTNGKNVVRFSFSRWEFLAVNVDGTEIVYKGYSKDNYGGWGSYGSRTYKMIRTNDAINLYVNNIIGLTITAEGITLPSKVTVSSGGANATAIKNAIASKFIGAEKEVAPLLYYASKNSVACGATYMCSIVKYVSVSGTISAAESVDLTATTLKVDGISTPVTVQADGSYTANITEGTHSLVFENSDYVAFADGVEAVSDVVGLNVTLKKNAYMVGDYKNFKNSTDVTYDKNKALDGVITVSGTTKSYALALPNSATTESAEFNIRINGYTWNGTESIRNEMSYGFGFTNGDSVLKISFSYWEFLDVVIDGKAIRYSGVNKTNFGGFGYYGRNYKIVRTTESIKVYVNDKIALTVTSEGITTPSTVKAVNSTNATAIKNLIVENFIGEGKDAALILCHDSKNSVDCGATYTCSITKN